MTPTAAPAPSFGWARFRRMEGPDYHVYLTQMLLNTDYTLNNFMINSFNTSRSDLAAFFPCLALHSRPRGDKACLKVREIPNNGFWSPAQH